MGIGGQLVRGNGFGWGGYNGICGCVSCHCGRYSGGYIGWRGSCRSHGWRGRKR